MYSIVVPLGSLVIPFLFTARFNADVILATHGGAKLSLLSIKDLTVGKAISLAADLGSTVDAAVAPIPFRNLRLLSLGFKRPLIIPPAA